LLQLYTPSELKGAKKILDNDKKKKLSKPLTFGIKILEEKSDTSNNEAPA